MTRIVLLPEELEYRLDELTTLKDEVNGVVFYRLQEERYCPIEKLCITGKGSPGHVSADPERVEIVNRFLDKHEEYRFIKFHTHSKGTIAQFGDYYATHFSQSDLDIYNEQLAMEPEFIGMVITPVTKLLHGADDPLLKIVEGYPINADIRISQELDSIAEAEGYVLEAFQSKRRK